jgi:hypothetical protein
MSGGRKAGALGMGDWSIPPVVRKWLRLGAEAPAPHHHRASLATAATWSPAPKIVFVHVMKTAGTSVVEWMQRHYHHREVLHEATTFDRLAAVPLEVRARKRFVRGHFGLQIATEFRPDQGFHLVTILRDPLERAISHFWHVHRAQGSAPSWTLQARHEGFGVHELLKDPFARPYFANYQVRNFAYVRKSHDTFSVLDPDLAMPDDVDDADLERAKSALEELDCVGFTENLRQFVSDMSERFGFHPDSSLTKQRSYRPRDIAFSPDALAALRKANELDHELYRWAQGRLLGRSKKSYFLLEQKVTPMSIPLDASGKSLLQWSSTEPFFGTGWSDTQCAGTSIDPPHRWMLGTNEANIVLRVKRGASYLLIIDVLRFVDEQQASAFSLRADSTVVPLHGPNPTASAGPSGGVFLARLGPRPSDICVLTFHVDDLKSFSEINPEDPDSTPRGIALRSVTLVALDEQGRVELGPLASRAIPGGGASALSK